MASSQARLSPAFAPRPAPPRRGGKQPESLWYALHLPQLQALTESRRRQCLLALAGLMESYSSDINLHETALVCEVRSALRYFGGIDAIHEKLGAAIKRQLREWELPKEFSHAAAPTISASLLLARAGGGKAVYRRANLHAVLQGLPVTVLRPDREQGRRLHNMGIRYLGDLWRLPVGGLVTRFGSAFVDQLDRALGKTPDKTSKTMRKYVAPPSFQGEFELPAESLDLDRLLPAAAVLLKRLCEFLVQRDLVTSRLEFSLLHERQEATAMRIELRRPGRCREHFMMLLQTRLGELELTAPVAALRLMVSRFDAYLDRDLQLFRNDKATGADEAGLDHLLEQLQARLGERRIRGIEAVADHRPEYASRDFDHAEGGKARPDTPVAGPPRPLWLLKEPRRLACRDGQPLYHGPVSLPSGPERIESGWWSGDDVRRDYYIGEEENGCRLWIYRERDGGRRWYLHGYFA